MDLVEVLSSLHALRQLYELLQNIEDHDIQHMNSKNVTQTLDLRARKLFKHLLDDATEKMFHTHSKITEAQSVVHKTPCSSQLEQPKAMPKLQSPLSPDTVNASLNVVLNNEKDSKSSMVTSEKDEQYPVKSQSAISVSKVTTSSDVPLYKKKRCRACIAKEMKRQYSTKDTTMSNDRAEVPDKNSGDQDQQRDWGSGNISFVDEQAKILPESNSKTIERETPIDETLLSPVSLTTRAGKQEVGYILIDEMKKNLDERDDFTKVVTNAIRQIESCILALQLSSDLTKSPINNVADEHVPFKLSISVSPVEHRKEEAIIRQEMNQTDTGESSWEKGSQLTQTSQKHEKTADPISRGQGSPVESYMKRCESLSRSASQNINKMVSYVNGQKVSPSPNKVTMKPPLQLKAVGLDQNQTGRRQTLRYNSSMPPQSMGSVVPAVGGGLGTRSSQTRRLKTGKRHDQIMMRPVFLDDDMPSQRTRTCKMSNVSSRKKIMLRQEELEEENSSSSSRSSSMWSSKQSESSASSCTNYSEESWSPRNDDFSESENNSQVSLSSSYHSSEEEDRSRLTDSVESDYSHRKYPNKSIGRLRRIKNKLGLIFHHHHHHHHHCHHHGNDRSTWKVQKMFHHKDKRGRNDHGQAQGVKKSLAVKNMSNKNQGGQFHALVNGLMRHTKHSKKTKGGIRTHQPHGLNKKKVVNKLHWWQTVRHGGVKLPKKGRVKVGFANKRPKLPMKR